MKMHLQNLRSLLTLAAMITLCSCGTSGGTSKNNASSGLQSESQAKPSESSKDVLKVVELSGDEARTMIGHLHSAGIKKDTNPEILSVDSILCNDSSSWLFPNNFKCILTVDGKRIEVKSKAARSLMGFLKGKVDTYSLGGSMGSSQYLETGDVYCTSFSLAGVITGQSCVIHEK
ncbi:MAG: hypothetical protein HQK54_08350 [Oligoflexales bacterium]|nr:hypothetical protein [Oligoflexales bacterium]